MSGQWCVLASCADCSVMVIYANDNFCFLNQDWIEIWGHCGISQVISWELFWYLFLVLVNYKTWFNCLLACLRSLWYSSLVYLLKSDNQLEFEHGALNMHILHWFCSQWPSASWGGQSWNWATAKHLCSHNHLCHGTLLCSEHRGLSAGATHKLDWNQISFLEKIDGSRKVNCSRGCVCWDVELQCFGMEINSVAFGCCQPYAKVQAHGQSCCKSNCSSSCKQVLEVTEVAEWDW